MAGLAHRVESERELLRRAGLIEGMESEQSLKTRYEIATYAFNEISKRNAEQALKGGHPTAEALEREDAAFAELAAARRAYMESLSADPAR